MSTPDLSEEVVHGVAGRFVVVAEDPQQPQDPHLSREYMWDRESRYLAHNSALKQRVEV